MKRDMVLLVFIDDTQAILHKECVGDYRLDNPILEVDLNKVIYSDEPCDLCGPEWE